MKQGSPEISRLRRSPTSWRTVTAALVLASIAYVIPVASEPRVVIIPEGPRDRFDCLNSELSRKRYQTKKACLRDLCGDVFAADRSSLYIQHPRNRSLVRNPCFMLSYPTK